MIQTFKKYSSKIINRQIISYFFFGLLTTILNIALFQVLLTAGLDYKLANIITLIIVKIVSYIVNKLFVFRNNVVSFFAVVKEFWQFMLTRGFTMLIDFFGVMLFVETFGFDPKLSKYLFIGIVVIINYFLGVKVFRSDIQKED